MRGEDSESEPVVPPGDEADLREQQGEAQDPRRGHEHDPAVPEADAIDPELALEEEPAELWPDSERVEPVDDEGDQHS